MLASIPASILNQRSDDLGIPNRFTLKSSRFSSRKGLGSADNVARHERPPSGQPCFRPARESPARRPRTHIGYRPNELQCPAAFKTHSIVPNKFSLAVLT